jgi:hypothetical protein
MIDRWLTRWSRNYAFLRRAVDSVGRDIARQPYESFLQADQDLAFTQLVDSVHIDFAVEVYRIDTDGTLWICVDARAALATPLGIKPSLVFRKCPDGSAWIQL